MATVKLGKTNALLFPVGLGCMPLSIDDRPDEAAAIRVIHRALELGVNFLDTANVYCIDDRDLGHNERLLKKALVARPNSTNEIFVATKGGLRRPGGDWVRNASPDELRRACEQSLRDLGVERIFLYQLHAPDPRIQLEESVDILAKLKEEGKILHVGLSNVSQAEIERAKKCVEIVSVQNRFNWFESTDLKNGLIDYCIKEGITYIAHSPVGGHHGHMRASQDKTLAKLAKKFHATPYEIMLAWIRSLGPHVIAIPGASRVESIESSVRSVALDEHTLTKDLY